MARKLYLHFAELHIGSSIRYENTLIKYHFLKRYIAKRNLISIIFFLSIYELNIKDMGFFKKIVKC